MSSEEQVQVIKQIIERAQGSIISAWQKAKLYAKDSNDFLALIEPGEGETVSVIVGPRTTLLRTMETDGLDIHNEAIRDIQKQAEPSSEMPFSSAIWVMVRVEGFVHLSKMTHQFMTQAGGVA